MADCKLIIANCRGSKPVIRDIKKCHTILGNVMVETNSCKGRTNIDKARDLLWEILEDNK